MKIESLIRRLGAEHGVYVQNASVRRWRGPGRCPGVICAEWDNGYGQQAAQARTSSALRRQLAEFFRSGRAARTEAEDAACN